MTGKMSIEQHRARLQKTYERWLHEVWGNGNVAVIDQVLADNFVDHRPLEWFGPTREGHKRLAADWHAAFPDMRLTIEDVVFKGDRLVGRYSGRGTHRGVFAGIPATGAAVSFTEVDVIRCEGDRIAEWWHNEGGQPLVECVRLAARVVCPGGPALAAVGSARTMVRQSELGSAAMLSHSQRDCRPWVHCSSRYCVACESQATHTGPACDGSPLRHGE